MVAARLGRLRPSAARPPLPPGPPAPPLIGHVADFRRDRLGFLQRCAREYGDVVGLRLGPYRLVLLSHPDLVHEALVARQRMLRKGPVLQAAKLVLGEGLLTSEGDLHRRQRRLLQPAFAHARIAGHAGVMAAYARRATTRWRDGQAVDVHAEMRRLSLAIAGKTLFDADIESEADEVSAALEEVIGLSASLAVPLAAVLRRLPLPSTVRLRRGRARLDATIHRLIARRRSEGRDHGDLLSALLAADMPDRQVRDEALTLLLAGHETTASALTWAWHLLGRCDDARARLHAEVDGVVGDGLPGFDDLARLAHTRAVLAEALRLYPPSWAMARRTLADYPVDGHVAPAGSLLVTSQWVVHRDPRWWAHPDRFDPDRWRADEPTWPRFAYFPFGAGSRACIGAGFAWTEGVLVLATTARHWELTPLAGGGVVPEPLMTLRPPVRLPMRARRRR